MKNALFRKTLWLIMMIMTISMHPAFAEPNELNNILNPNITPNPQSIGNVPNIQADAAILVDAKRGQILYQKFPTKTLHISIANKIMSCIIAIDSIEKLSFKLDSKVTISRKTTQVAGKSLTLEAGVKYSLEDLLYAVMLTSANDASVALAEYIGGDTDTFVKYMNEKAQNLNMKDTVFANPTGLYDEHQYTTAYDLSLLMKYALNNPIFNQIFSTKIRLILSDTGNSEVLKSQNELFWSYDGMDGGKIGFNDHAISSMISSATKGNQRLICITLNSPNEAIYSDCTAMMNYCFNNFRLDILVPSKNTFQSYQIENTKVNLINLDTIYYTHPIWDAYVKEVLLNTPNTLSVPVSSKTMAGSVKYILNDNTSIDVILYPDQDIKPPDSFYTRIYQKISENRNILFMIIVLAGIEVLLILYKLLKLIRRVVLKNRQSTE